MDPDPGTFAVRTGGGRSARLVAVGFVAVIGLVVGAGWFGRSAPAEQATIAVPSPGGSASGLDLANPSSPTDGQGPVIAAPDGAAAVRGIVVGRVDAVDPPPGGSVPGTGILGISGRILTYEPDRVYARLRIAGRKDVIGSVGAVEGGAFAGWLRVRPPDTAVDAQLDLYDAVLQLAPKQPLASYHFRLDPPPPVTIDRPSVPFEVITTRDLVVRGTSDPEVRRILVTLEGRNNRVIERVIVGAVRPAGAGAATGPGASTGPGATTGPGDSTGPGVAEPRLRWVARLELPAPHPNGTMVIEVIPFDGVADPDRFRLRLAVVIGALSD